MPSAPLSGEKLIEIYTKMLTIRAFEEKAYELYYQGLVKGAIHAYIGQEAVAVGCIAALRPDDYVIFSYRGHAHSIAKGAKLSLMFAELLGKKTGYCKGKGGSMHVTDLSVGNLGAYAIAGSQIPMAAGAGLSIKLRGTGQVCVCFFGDGASNNGYFHEGLNLAAIWKLPVVFVCENNFYAVTTPVSISTGAKDIADRAVGYGIPGAVVDGMDVFAVYRAASEAVERARRGEGPTLLECKTYRFMGHSRTDPPYGPYRSKEEWESWKRRDPIPLLQRRLLEERLLDEAQDKAIRDAISKDIDEAVKFAVESPYPEPEELYTNVYA